MKAKNTKPVCTDCGLRITRRARTGCCVRCTARKTGLTNVINGHIKRLGALPQSKIARQQNMLRARNSSRAREVFRHNGLIAIEQIRNLPQTKTAQRLSGQRAVVSGQLALARERLGMRPTLPEAIFYGLIFGLHEFRFQKTIPTAICSHRVDAVLGSTIFELDAGGHHAFGDRTEHDHNVDEEYKKMGYRVVRANSPEDLFLRVLQRMADGALE